MEKKSGFIFGLALCLVQLIFVSIYSHAEVDANTNINADEGKKDCVILLHGLGRTTKSMARLERVLTKDGYMVVNQNYPSRQFPIETLSRIAIQKAVAACDDTKGIHFVTHSMGGILVRQYLSVNDIPNLRRVVMLAPPNAGSEIADNLVFAKSVSGPALSQLVTNIDKSLPKKLGRVDFELGVIAGDRSINPILSLLLPGKDDGKVSVESAKVSGMKAMLVLPVTHPFITYNSDVIKQTVSFLRQGKFKDC